MRVFSMPGYGEVTVTVRSSARRMVLRIGADMRLRVTVPFGVGDNEIRKFITQNAEGISRAMEKVRVKQPPNSNALFAPEMEFRTRRHKLRMMPTSRDNCYHATIGNEWLSITYPPNTNTESLRFQKFVAKAIGMTYKHEALDFLPQMVDHFARAHGLKYDHVDLRDMGSQWGSCSSTGRICLNVQLMKLPDRLIELVVAHELTHTLHMDHSKAFYADLDRFLGGRHDILNAELKKHNTIVTPADSYDEA